MEVGAVKQAFNNEVILLKKNLNQAKIQIIHKLTRKAKQLTEKKAPEKLKDKLKRKAESAVKEVLIIKKIKARDIAKFIVTHSEELKKYLNRPQVDNDKACARLLLHKSMQEKYSFIRNRFSNVPIKDLFMSRQERIKLKKEEKEKQKKKKKDKMNKAINKEGAWNVEDLNDTFSMDDDQHNNSNDDLNEDQMSDNESSKSDISRNGSNGMNEKDENSDLDDQSNEENSSKHESEDEINDNDNNMDEIPETVGKFVKLIPDVDSKKSLKKTESEKSSKKLNVSNIKDSKEGSKFTSNAISTKTNACKKLKDMNKNRNLNEKIQHKKFKKITEGNIVTDNKVVDPFFITSTGEHYMSLAEPRQPDEVKEVHKQGNRKLRRAVMFGHELKSKPRNNYDEQNAFRNNNNMFKNDFKGKNDKNVSNDRRSFNNRIFNSYDKSGNTNVGNSFNGRKGDFNKRKLDDTSRFGNKVNEKPKDEKLHPSWEAKKRQSGILPFQGKKIVFDES